MVSMKRRTFVAGAGALIAAPAILSLVNPKSARATMTFTLGHGAAPGNPR